MTRALPLCALAVASCVAVEARPRMAPGVERDEDEARLWELAAKVEKTLGERGMLHADAALDEYLLSVARRLQPPEVLAANPLRVRVVADPHPNAFALPNGAMYVHTALLARMESEAELAAVLAHETAHVTHRDHLKAFRRAQDWTTGEVGLARLASLGRFQRGDEDEADREAVARVAAAGYDLRDSVKLLERLRDWTAAAGEHDDASPYESHRPLEQRIETCRALVARSRTGGVRNADAFVQRTASVLLGNARTELAAGAYRAAWDQVQRYLGLRPADASAHLLLGEIARRDGTAGSAESALSSYRRAVDLDPRSAEAWRGLGLVLEKRGARAEARDAFGRYLELSPQAPDRAHVEAAIRRLSGGRP